MSILSCIQEHTLKFLSRWYLQPTRLHVIFPQISDQCWRCHHSQGSMLQIWWACPLLIPFWTDVFDTYAHIVDMAYTSHSTTLKSYTVACLECPPSSLFLPYLFPLSFIIFFFFSFISFLSTTNLFIFSVLYFTLYWVIHRFVFCQWYVPLTLFSTDIMIRLMYSHLLISLLWTKFVAISVLTPCLAVLCLTNDVWHLHSVCPCKKR